MKDKITEFLDDVCSHIKCKAAHEGVRRELKSHIEDRKEEFMNGNYPEEEAVSLAVAAMGDGEEIGCQLNKQHKFKTEWWLLGLVSMIAAIGGVVMYASSKFESPQGVDFQRYLLSTFLGISALVICYFFDYSKLEKAAWPIYGAAHSLLFFTIIFGKNINGRAHFVLGEYTFTSEYASLLFLIAFVGFLKKSKGEGFIALGKLSALALLSLVPIAILPRLFQALLLCACYFIITVTAVIKGHFGGNRRKQLFALGGVCAVGVAAIGYKCLQGMDRINAFLSGGQNDSAGSGWIYVMADKWRQNSTWFGKTSQLVEGSGIDVTMPNVTTEYVLINVMTTLGKAAGVALILLISLLVIKMFLDTVKIKNNFGFYLAIGVSTMLSVQFLVNILMNFNILPAVGVGLPFVSYGGTAYITNMALMGIFLSVWRRNKIPWAE